MRKENLQNMYYIRAYRFLTWTSSNSIGLEWLMKFEWKSKQIKVLIKMITKSICSKMEIHLGIEFNCTRCSNIILTSTLCEIRNLLIHLELKVNQTDVIVIQDFWAFICIKHYTGFPMSIYAKHYQTCIDISLAFHCLY